MPFSLESKGGYGSTTEAYIFSLRNKEAIGPFKSKVKRELQAIYRDKHYGPVFGKYDIAVTDEANKNENSYTNFGQPGNVYNVPSGVKDSKTILAGTHHFSPDEWEVFYLA